MNSHLPRACYITETTPTLKNYNENKINSITAVIFYRHDTYIYQYSFKKHTHTYPYTYKILYHTKKHDATCDGKYYSSKDQKGSCHKKCTA